MRQLPSRLESLTIVAGRQNGYYLLSISGPRPISPSPSQVTSAINRELHLLV
ncbi:hypothetical protein Hanom_Chr12g01153651 [Helianthus anomalus]